jgi:hypothetical protein
MSYFFIAEPEKRDQSFKDPEKNQTACDDQGPLPGLNICKKMRQVMHKESL